jgi:hypothetical protein
MKRDRIIHIIPLIMAAGMFFPAWWLRSSHNDPFNKALGGAMMGIAFLLFAYYILRELFKD